MPRRLLALLGLAAATWLLGALVHPRVGSGTTCPGIGFGCTPEQETDTLLVCAAFLAGGLTTLFVARRAAAVACGAVVTVLLTGAVYASQLPHHPIAPGRIDGAAARWQAVLDAGRRVAPPGSALGAALAGLRPQGPTACRDRYERPTGGHAVEWRHEGDSGDPLPPAVLTAWAARARALGFDAAPDTSDPRDQWLRVSSGGGHLTVRVAAYAGLLEIRGATACHRR